MNKKHFPLLISLLLFGICNITFAQGDMPPNTEPGKCYAKCLMLDQYQTYEKDFPIFTGVSSDSVDLDTLYFSEKEDTRELILLGRLPDLSHEDLKNLDALEQIVCVPNRNQTEDFIMETFFFLKLKRKGGFREWREVLCTHNIGQVIDPLQEALMEAGYLESKEKINVLNKEVLGALAKYQKDHNLPIGELDVETLEHLEIYFY